MSEKNLQIYLPGSSKANKFIEVLKKFKNLIIFRETIRIHHYKKSL